MIFKRIRVKPELTDSAAVGTILGCSQNGWVNTELFIKYVKYFVKFVNYSKERKVLLIFDRQITHIKSLEVIDYARDNDAVLISLPPQTSHKFQPLDTSIDVFNNLIMNV